MIRITGRENNLNDNETIKDRTLKNNKILKFINETILYIIILFTLLMLIYIIIIIYL